MRLLILGGAGYIGSHFCVAALESRHKILVVDNLSRGHRQAVPDHAEFLLCDLNDDATLSPKLKEFDPELVVHFAAYALVGESLEKPELYQRNNVLGTQNLVKVLDELRQPPPVVFSSSCAVYGNPSAVPVTEKAPLQPLSPYGESKRQCEQVLQTYSEKNATPVVCLRYFNVAGADNDAGIGEDHSPETHLVPSLLKRLSQGDPIEIFGNDYPTADGTCVRDYIHVQDVAKAHLQAIDKIQQQQLPNFHIYNLGSGRGYSNWEVVKIAAQVLGVTVTPQFGPRRPGDAAVLYADTSLAEKELGFVAEYDLKAMIHSAHHWHSSCPEGFRTNTS